MISECASPDWEYCDVRKRRADSHHLYWPANKYITPLETAFRELEVNKVQMCQCLHRELHKEMFPPKKPSVSEMCLALMVEFDNEV